MFQVKVISTMQTKQDTIHNGTTSIDKQTLGDKSYPIRAALDATEVQIPETGKQQRVLRENDIHDYFFVVEYTVDGRMSTSEAGMTVEDVYGAMLLKVEQHSRHAVIQVAINFAQEVGGR